MSRVLLVEPGYHNKFPPIGLMKMATFFRQRGDVVRYIKGKSTAVRALGWDAVYVTSLMTFEWKRTLETVRFYQRTPGVARVVVGGIAATLMASEMEAETGAVVVPGLLNRPGALGLDGDESIDRLVPDYSILGDVDYHYPVEDSYFVHSTRGCVNRCSFCAVPRIEPEYEQYLPLKEQVLAIQERHGVKKDLILLDNNTVASPDFHRIIDEILELGFSRGTRLKGRLRYVDFNQGLDARPMTRDKMAHLAETSIRPLRVAFDDIRLRTPYENCVRWAAEFGLTRLSNYVLFNANDTPRDFYERLRISIDLNEKLGTQIYSFPMRYSPVNRTDRTYIGSHWTWRYVRGVQCILNVTRGVVGIGRDFFLRAFGNSPEEFIRLISMPEDYIMQRDQYEGREASDWMRTYDSLNDTQRAEFESLALHSRRPDLDANDSMVRQLLAHY